MGNHNLPPIKLVCFDMDNTLTKRDTYKYLRGETGASKVATNTATDDDMRQALTRGESDNGIKNQPELLQTMRDLMDAGIKIAIVSHNGYHKQFPVVFRAIGLNEKEIKKIIIAPFDHKKEDSTPESKLRLIAKARAGSGVLGRTACKEKHTVMVDDNADFVSVAQGAGYAAIKVPRSDGDIGYLNKLREMCGLEKLPVPERPAAEAAPPQTDAASAEPTRPQVSVEDSTLSLDEPASALAEDSPRRSHLPSPRQGGGHRTF